MCLHITLDRNSLFTIIGFDMGQLLDCELRHAGEREQHGIPYDPM